MEFDNVKHFSHYYNEKLDREGHFARHPDLKSALLDAEDPYDIKEVWAQHELVEPAYQYYGLFHGLYIGDHWDDLLVLSPQKTAAIPFTLEEVKQKVELVLFKDVVWEPIN
jgi:hypothetical protein